MLVRDFVGTLDLFEILVNKLDYVYDRTENEDVGELFNEAQGIMDTDTTTYNIQRIINWIEKNEDRATRFYRDTIEIEDKLNGWVKKTFSERFNDPRDTEETKEFWLKYLRFLVQKGEITEEQFSTLEKEEITNKELKGK